MNWIYHDGHAVNMDRAESLSASVGPRGWEVYALPIPKAVAGPFDTREEAQAWIADYVGHQMPSAECDHKWDWATTDTCVYEVCTKCKITKG